MKMRRFFALWIVAFLLFASIATQASGTLELGDPDAGCCIQNIRVWATNSLGATPTGFSNKSLTGYYAGINPATGTVYLKGDFTVTPSATHDPDPSIDDWDFLTEWKMQVKVGGVWTDAGNSGDDTVTKQDGTHSLFEKYNGDMFTGVMGGLNANAFNKEGLIGRIVITITGKTPPCECTRTFIHPIAFYAQ